MPRIFISYRRDDSGYVVRMLYDKLALVFGESSIFIDIDNIPLGVDYREHLNQAVANCDILLAVIGDAWRGLSVDGSFARIDSPGDFVRIEIEAALARGIPVVPVLVEGAKLTSPELLPAGLQALAFRQAAEVRPGRELMFQMDSLIRGLEAHFRRADTLMSRENTGEMTRPLPKPTLVEEKKSTPIGNESPKPNQHRANYSGADPKWFGVSPDVET